MTSEGWARCPPMNKPCRAKGGAQGPAWAGMVSREHVVGHYTRVSTPTTAHRASSLNRAIRPPQQGRKKNMLKERNKATHATTCALREGLLAANVRGLYSWRQGIVFMAAGETSWRATFGGLPTSRHECKERGNSSSPYGVQRATARRDQAFSCQRPRPCTRARYRTSAYYRRPRP